MKKNRQKKIIKNKIIRYSLEVKIFISCLFILLAVFSYISNPTYYGLGKYKINLNNELNEKLFINNIDKYTKKDLEYHPELEIIDTGYDIYSPSKNKAGYRYGPSIIYYKDGTMDAYFASNADNVEWDWITYRHFDGKNWSNEKIVLQPNGNSYDRYSTCDPGVIYFNGYYYLGYTSTIVATSGGINNNAYVARSKNPDGPFEKWNGNGWGGDPAPIIYYDENDAAWGTGELSFVINDDKLYCYYSWICPEGNVTKVAIGRLEDNWPNTLEDYGTVINKEGDQDSADVIYLNDINKFVAFAITNRFSSDSGITMYESKDGINFKKIETIRSNLIMHAHNMGISKMLDGHVDAEDNLLIGYAYSNNSKVWGKWALRFHNVKLNTYVGNTVKHDVGGSSTYISNYLGKTELSNIIGISVLNRTIDINVSSSKKINIYSFNANLQKKELYSKVKIVYDSEYLEVNEKTITALKEGETNIDIFYDEYHTSAKVLIHPKNYKNNSQTNVIDFKPVEENMLVHLDSCCNKQIRGKVTFDNLRWYESFNDYTKDHKKFKANVDADSYLMTYVVEDETIIKVNNIGIITPLKIGNTNVTVYLNNVLSFKINVMVRQ